MMKLFVTFSVQADGELPAASQQQQQQMLQLHMCARECKPFISIKHCHCAATSMTSTAASLAVCLALLRRRATRGNMFLRQTPVGSVRDPATGELQEKHVFVVFYAGERARTKVLKVRGEQA